MYKRQNYFFPLIASGFLTVLWSLTYTATRYRTRFSLTMEVDGTAETSVFGENNGPWLNSPGTNFNNIDYVRESLRSIYIFHGIVDDIAVIVPNVVNSFLLFTA